MGTCMLFFLQKFANDIKKIKKLIDVWSVVTS